jgi:predicted nucleic acid-binding protein
VYLDTGALIKLYYPEVESQKVHELVRRENRAILFTSLHELEIKNAFTLKVFRSEMSDEVHRQLVSAINSDVHTSVLRRVHPNWGTVFRHSLEISGRGARGHPLPKNWTNRPPVSTLSGHPAFRSSGGRVRIGR